VKRTQATRDTRTEILDAAQSIIQTHGANGISYQHISDLVKIRKASIHYHFPTKDKLIEELVRRYSRDFLDLVDQILHAPTSAPTKLKRYIDLFEKTLADKSGMKVCLCGILGAELASLGNPAVRLLRRFYWDNVDRLARILEAGRAAGALKFAGDGKTLGTLIFSLLEGAMILARADGGVNQFRALKNQLLKLLSA